MIKLTEAEIWFCRYAGGLRGLMARNLNVKDKRMADISGFAIDEDGMIGEYAFCKWKNVFCDVVPSPRSGSADCNLGGWNIDVKATRYSNGRLLVTLKDNPDVDLYVLAIIDGNIVKFPGYAFRSEVCRDENIVNLGHGPGYAITQDRLRPFKSDQMVAA
jgi:hypothetical protein